MSDLDLRFPALSDLRARARRRLPRVSFEYLDSATGTEAGARRNRERLDAVRFMPAILSGEMKPDLQVRFAGVDYALPVGIAPVGMSGMIWPGAEATLARFAAERRIPYGLSTVAAADPEEVGPIAGEMGWFQLYPPADPEIRRDMLERAKAAGFATLVMTVDVPGESRRERQRRANISMPPKITAGMLLDMMRRPVWTAGMARRGMPRMRLPESYVTDAMRSSDAFVHAGRVIRGYPDWDYLAAVREEWDGPFAVKGVMDPDDAVRLRDAGVDILWVSNHSARQFEAGPAPIDQLPLVREAVGPDAAIVYDSGIASGLDVLRALARGADFTMTGRSFHYALAALGERGLAHWLHVLEADMRANMAQIGARSLSDLEGRLVP